MYNAYKNINMSLKNKYIYDHNIVTLAYLKRINKILVIIFLNILDDS